MPPRIPGYCTICGQDAMLDSLLRCPECAAKSSRIVEPPVADDDTQPIPTLAPRPAKLAPPRREPVWLHGQICTVECDPQDQKAEEALAAMGYTLTAEMKDPRTGMVTSHVWARIDEGC